MTTEHTQDYIPRDDFLLRLIEAERRLSCIALAAEQEERASREATISAAQAGVGRLHHMHAVAGVARRFAGMARGLA